MGLRYSCFNKYRQLGGAKLYSHNIRTSLIALTMSLVCVNQGLAQTQDTAGTAAPDAGQTTPPTPPQDSTTAATPPANPVSSPLVSVSPSMAEKIASHHRRKGDNDTILVTAAACRTAIRPRISRC
jgi:hypothetical protein